MIQLRSTESHRNFAADVGLDINIENAAFHVEYKLHITKLALDEFMNTYRSVNYFCEADKIKYKLFT